MTQFDLTDRDTIFNALPRGGVGVEVGVGNGRFSVIILQRAEPRLLYLVDCWELQPIEVYGHDPGNANHDEKYQEVLDRFLTEERVHIIKAFSASVAAVFPDGYFDWVYLDANHLRCREDIDAWWPLVKSCGHLMGHDYCTVGDYVRVKQDVDQWVGEIGLPLLTTDDEVWKNWIVQKP